MNTQSLIDQSTLNANPNDWQERKKVAVQMYQQEMYLEAADLVWNAPEIPSTDLDVAFTLKIVSRARANRAIRLTYEVIKRNRDKPKKNMAFAKALNVIGMPMLASRFYGAAMAADEQFFDLGFEQQTMWCDESEALLEAWSKSSQGIEQPFKLTLEQTFGDPIHLAKLVRDQGAISEPLQNDAPAKLKPVLKPAQPTGSLQAKPVPPKPSIGRPPTANPVSGTAPLRPSVPMTGPLGAKPVGLRTATTQLDTGSNGEDSADLKHPPKPMLPPVAPPAQI
ncbi:hypothetical protein [Rubritalea marina]|uniref:hypothetical protein n=1 Tax=Rubritalea marina TaxID=361055 RepID=UPI000380D9DE|nr:hypothetical protein [Rubritalea marina]